jgi:glycosyltransferase involved in cell wall biosynthesis
VIVPARDAERHLPACLSGLAAELARHDGGELIVVDSASRDATAEIARRSGAVVVTAERAGAAAARNAGACAAHGDRLVFLDSDCRPLAGWLEALLRPLEDPEVGGVGGRVQAAPPTTLLERYAERRGDITQEPALNDPYLPWVLTANCCYRKEVLDALGGFDVELRSGEDVDFAWRMQLRLGRRLAYAPDAVVEHRHRTDLRALGRQWVRYGWGAVQLQARHPQTVALVPRRQSPWRWGAARSVRLGWAVMRLPSKRTALDIAEPFLDAYIRAAERLGRRRARAAIARAGLSSAASDRAGRSR